MKKLLLFLSLFSIQSLCAQSGPQALPSSSVFEEAQFLDLPAPEGVVSSLTSIQQKELAAIMEVIKAETDCFYNRDIECWKKHWVQDTHTFQGWNNSDGTFDAFTGWATIKQKATAYIKANPIGSKNAPRRQVIRKNMVIKFYSDQLAYLVWDQYNENRKDDAFTKSKDSRIMEKHDGEWKIANMTAFWNYGRQYTAAELKE